MCGVRRYPLLYYLALGQLQSSYHIHYILFGKLQIDGHDTNFIPCVISAQ